MPEVWSLPCALDHFAISAFNQYKKFRTSICIGCYKVPAVQKEVVQLIGITEIIILNSGALCSYCKMAAMTRSCSATCLGTCPCRLCHCLPSARWAAAEKTCCEQSVPAQGQSASRIGCSGDTAASGKLHAASNHAVPLGAAHSALHQLCPGASRSGGASSRHLLHVCAAGDGMSCFGALSLQEFNLETRICAKPAWICAEAHR